MKRKFSKQALVAALLVSGTTLATAAEQKPYLGFMGTYNLPDAARQLDDGFGATGLLGFPVNRYFSPELNFFGLGANRNAGGSENSYGGGLNFAIFPFGREPLISPFLLLGGGVQHDRHASGDETSGYANAGGGLLFRMNRSGSAAFRIEAGRYGVFDNGITAGRSHVLDTRISAGVQIALGDHGDDAPPPPPPPPAPVDSDGDGVPDNVDKCPNTPRGVRVTAFGCIPPVAKPAAPVPVPDSDGDGVPDNLDKCANTPLGMRVDAQGCAIKAAVVVLRDLNFELNKSQLTASAQRALDTIAAGLKGQPTMRLTINGYTDSTGSHAYNLKLSKARAAAARNYLVALGVDGSRLQAQGYGESQPVASNRTAEGRAQNRRVEFRVTQQ